MGETFQTLFPLLREQDIEKLAVVLLLITLVLALHLLAMNLASSGPLLCIWLCRGPKDGEGIRQCTGHRLAWYSLAALLVGSGLGLALLVLPPSAGLMDAVGRFPERAYWFAGAELVFSLGCLLIFWLGCGPRSWCKTAFGRWMNAGVALLSVSNLLYHFPPLMVVIAKLAAKPTWIEAETVDRAVFLQFMFRGEVLSRCVHFWLASIAVAGVAVLWILSRKKNAGAGDGDIEQKQVARGAARVALVACVLQLPVGVWVMLTLPSRSFRLLTGGSLMGSMLLFAGILSALLLIQRLGMIALGETNRHDLKRACWLLLLVLVLMTATQQAARMLRSTDTPNTKNKAQGSEPLGLSIVSHGRDVFNAS